MFDRVVAVIPARGGSKRLPRKNLALLGGQPLISHTIRAALLSTSISTVVVSTDELEIARLSEDLGAVVLYPRPAELATDTASTADVLRHVVSNLEGRGIEVEVVVLLQPTSPFRTSDHIDAALNLFYTSNADALTSVRLATDHPCWLWKKDGDYIIPLNDLEHISLGRHQLPQYYIENGAIYVIKRSVLFQNGLYGSKVVPFIMSALESVDIDEPLDLAFAEFLLSQQHVSLENRA
jgi:CMP-N-acetylneuraminic acid synthetase